MLHKSKFLVLACLLLASSMVLNACSPLTRIVSSSTGTAPSPVIQPSGSTPGGEPTPQPETAGPNPLDNLVNYLNSSGLQVEGIVAWDSSLLDSTQSFSIKLPGSELFIYDFVTSEAAKAASQRIGPDGTEIHGADESISSVRWAGSPHFWLFQNFIIQYLGDDETIIGGLDKALGKQFAGMSNIGDQSALKNAWKEVRVEANQIGFAVPCWWLVGEMPAEGALRSLSMRSYDDGFFQANSVKGEWKDLVTPEGAYKVDITLAEVIDPASSTIEAYSAFMDPTMSEITNTEEVKIGENTWTVLTLRNLVNSADEPGDVYIYRLAQNQLLIVSAYPWPEAISSGDLQAILSSFAFSSEQAVLLPNIEPHAPLIEASCAQ